MSETDPLPRRTYTVREVATSLGVGTRLVERMCQAGEIDHLRLGRRILIPAATLDALVASAKVQATK